MLSQRISIARVFPLKLYIFFCISYTTLTVASLSQLLQSLAVRQGLDSQVQFWLAETGLLK